jgi:subtilase family serine protease
VRGKQALAAIGVAFACAVTAVCLGTSGSATAAQEHPLGSTFVPNGPVVSFGHKGNGLCPGKVCYTPQQLQAAYDFPTGKRAPTGAGQTIVVAVAFGSSTIEDDLASFDSLFGLPSTQISYCGAPSQTVDPNWAVETSADVEYAHAMAPGAKIVLAVAPSDDDDTVAQTVAACSAAYPGSIVSMSFGDDEDLVPDSALATFRAAFDAGTAAGSTFLSGTGDFGATDGDPYAIAAYPASDPLVTAVGGTEGDPYPQGLLRGNGNHYGHEQVWKETDLFPFEVASGGAPSILFDVPDYQAPFNGSDARTVADVAYNASINGGELVVFGGQLGNFGGTSVGPAHWAAIFALANELRAGAGQDPLGQANPALYAIAGDHHAYDRDFNDVTRGDNAANSDIGFSAGKGYDIPTGLGTPDVANLLSDLAGSPSHHGHGPPPKPHKPPKPGPHRVQPG